MNDELIEVAYRRTLRRRLPKTVDAEEMSLELDGKYSPDRLVELAEENKIPHILFGQSQPWKPFFIKTDVIAWAVDHLLENHPEAPPAIIPIGIHSTEACTHGAIPPCLSSLGVNLRAFHERISISAVYILCDGDEVIYIGQSIDVETRIISHKRKEYTKVYYIHVPENHLLSVECELIRLLLPKFNRAVLSETEPTKAVSDAYVDTDH